MPAASDKKGSSGSGKSKRATTSGRYYRSDGDKGRAFGAKDADIKWEMKATFKPPKKIPDSMLQMAKTMFFTLDRDSSGSIDAEELGLMLRSLGQNPTDAELEELIQSVDGDGGEKDGKIQLREFLTLYANAIDDDGKPAKANVGKEDAANVLTSMGGDRADSKAVISGDSIVSTLQEQFDLAVNLKDTFGVDGELSQSDVAKILGVMVAQ